MGIREDKTQNGWMQQYQSYLKEIMLKDYDYFVAVTRKGYYFMKMQPCFQQNRRFRKKTLRDRDILKKYDYGEFYGKKILLIDDTANTGETLKHLKNVLEEKTNPKAVDVSAFAVSAQVLKEQNKLFTNSQLFFWCLLSEEDMARFSLYELHEIHNQMIPYVIDLPVFEKVTFSEEQFQKILQGNKENWKFYDYTFELHGETYKNGFFLYENEAIRRILGDTLLANIIKCRYRLVEKIDGNKEYEVVFTPFTILKSADYHEMVLCAESLYKGTNYEKVMKNRKKDTTDNYVGIYRDVVYNLSWFIGYLFKEYICFQYGKTLKWNDNLTSLDQNNSLRASMEDIFGGQFQVQDYFERLKECRFTYWRKSNIYIDENSENDFDKIRNFILGELSLKKLQELQKCDSDSAVGKQDVLFEDIEKMMTERFSFKNIMEFRYCFIKIILLALDCSFMSNTLKEENGEIKRAFQFGECSEIYFGYDIRLFYYAVSEYYNNVKASSEKYYRNYDEFIKQLYGYLQYNDYFKFGYITLDDFNYFKKYFKLKGNILEREIRNKRFLLDDSYVANPYNIAVVKFVSNLKFD